MTWPSYICVIKSSCGVKRELMFTFIEQKDQRNKKSLRMELGILNFWKIYKYN